MTEPAIDSSRKADTDTDADEQKQAFSRAYSTWRDELCEESLDGMPIADSDAERLWRLMTEASRH